VAVVWTFWSDPPPFEMDWLSELVDLSGCSVTHWLDLQMRCRGSVFSDSTFSPGSHLPMCLWSLTFQKISHEAWGQWKAV